MTENTTNEVVSLTSNSTTDQSSVDITINQPTETPTVSEVSPASPLVANLSTLSLGVRTMERSRVLVNNISNTIEEIQPYIEQRTGISWPFWLNTQRQRSDERTLPVQITEDTYVINVEASPESETENTLTNSPADHSHHHHTTSTDNYLNNIREAANAENQNNDTQDIYSSLNPETRKILKILQKYVPFLVILFIKYIYDYKVKIGHFLVLLLATVQADSDLKREILKQQNRSHMALLGILMYVTGCIVFVNFVFGQTMTLHFATPTSAWELIWYVAITDFMLKLITIILKIILTCLPAKIVALQSRGKYYLMLEATSQLYRCIAPIQPWLYFLFEAYQGVEKIFGICLIGIYLLSKGSDILLRAQLYKHANVGSFPTKSQLLETGGICTICHEEYSTPVRLHCKHIFCELCIITWLNRELSCPLCRALVTDNPIYRDGHTTHFIQLF